MSGAADVSICTFSTRDPQLLQAFVSFNLEWIKTYFVVEAMDRAQLEDPYSRILNVGGEIFFVLEDGRPVATAAMIPHGDGFELAKMAVSSSARGRGYGDRLIEAVAEWAYKKGAREISLLSNTILAPAISLYKMHGFVTTNLGPHPDYERCNIEMKRELRRESKCIDSLL